VTILPYVHDRSTSRIIERIRAAGGAGETQRVEEAEAAAGRGA
jgi:hypothetical protein